MIELINKHNIDTLKILIYKEWIVKYKGTYLGYIWSIAHPLILAVVFFIGFKIVMKVHIEDYTLFLIVALFPWQWFTNSLFTGSFSFITNATLIKKTVFPKFLLPLSSTIVDMIHFIVSVPIILIALSLYDKQVFYISWVYLFPLLILLQISITYAFALLFGTLNLFFRDIERLVSLLLTLLIYLTPIFYSMDLIPKDLRYYFYFNPMVPMINMWRDFFYNGSIEIIDLGIMLIHIIFWISLAAKVYKKFEPLFAERS